MEDLIEIVIPEDVKEGSESLFGTWLKQIGDTVSQHEPIAEVNTDKATIEVCSPATGVLKATNIVGNDPVRSGMVIGVITASQDVQSPNKIEIDHPGKSTSKEQVPPGTKLTPDTTTLRASPAVKRLAARYGIDLHAITGTGRNARITKADIAHLLPDRGGVASPIAQKRYRPQPIVAPGKRVPHDHMRKRIADHMQYSVQVAPHVTAVFECDLTSIISHREARREQFEKEGIQLTYTAYFVQAAVLAIREVPEVNSAWHDEYLEIFEDYNIGVGTSLGDKGLVVPVVKQAQKLSLKETAAQLTNLIGKAREGKISPDELRNGTFTISNHGVSGSLVATPIIIHQPQSAILGIGKLERRAIVNDQQGKEQVVIRPMLYVTLTIDHRAVDAYQTNQFLTKFVSVLENWELP